MVLLSRKTGFACLTVTIQFDSIRYINYTRGDTSSQPSGSPNLDFGNIVYIFYIFV